MLVQTEKWKLGDGLLDFKQQSHKLKEENEALAAPQRERDQAELANQAMRSGQQLHSSEFIYRIHKLNPLIVVFRGRFEGFLTLYIPNADCENGLHYLQAAFYAGWMPEHTYVTLDDHQLIKTVQEGGIHRGWRTILLRLLQAGVVTWQQVMDEFGDATGLAATRWHKDTQRFRN
jgi:hypothetical protein